jgi:hypothetical protein
MRSEKAEKAKSLISLSLGTSGGFPLIDVYAPDVFSALALSLCTRTSIRGNPPDVPKVNKINGLIFRAIARPLLDVGAPRRPDPDPGSGSRQGRSTVPIPVLQRPRQLARLRERQAR